MRLAAALPLALLLAHGLAFAAVALGFAPLVFDDHPGQLYRVWHVVRHGPAPWAWNPGWWAGYPELQFYPPGFAYLGALLHHASLGGLSVPGAYHAVLWLAYLAPGLTVYALLRRVLGSGWAALPGAFIALTLSAGLASGVEGGVRWGMVAARLGWALLPLVPLALGRWAEDPRAPWPALAVPPLVAAVVLTHPAHGPTAVVMVILGALGGASRWRGRLGAAAAGLALGAGLSAFWTVPLLLRLEETRALAWGSLGLLARPALRAPLPWVLVGLALLAPVLARGATLPRPRTVVALRRLPWLMAVIVAADAFIAEPLGIRWLPAERVADGAWLAVVLAAGTAAGLAVLVVARRLAAAPAALAAVAVLAGVGLAGGSLALWPRAGDWPRAEGMERGLRLPALWSLLATAPEGRVLFVRSAVPLVFGEAWYRAHTHVTALAPIATGRAIVNGTFTHPSPIAALVYRGDAGGGPVRTLAEQLDGRTLFGRPLAALDAATLGAHADALRVSVIVAVDEDVPSLPALEDSAAFPRRAVSPPFVVHARARGQALPEPLGGGRWRAPLQAAADGWAGAGFAYYPLWRAEQAGAPVATRRGRMGELQVRPPRPQAPVELVYAPGPVEWSGLGLSVAALAVWLAAGWRRRRAATPAGRS